MEANQKGSSIGQRLRARMRGASTSFSLVIALVIICVIWTVFTKDHVFFTLRNFTNILVNSSITSIMAAGATIAMLLGGMDVSQYAVATLASVTAAMTLGAGVPTVFAILAALAVAALAGIVNGFLVAHMKISAVVTTMGTMQMFRGVAYIITGAKTIMISDKAYLVLGRYYIGDIIPVSVLLVAAIYVIVFYVLKYTSFGRKIFSVGGNKQASYLSGIDPTGVTMASMVASALCAGVAGVLLASQTGAAIPSTGVGNEMTVLAGVILGGISLSGGKGHISGTILGVLVISTISNGLTLCNVDSFIQMIVDGFVLIAAVLLDLFRNGTYKKAS